MISYNEALKILQREITPLAAQNGSPGNWLGGVTATAVDSASAVPAFGNSAMDGFALRSTDTATASPSSPVELDVWGTIAAGDAPLDGSCPAGAAEIMTGAIVPPGCDAIVPLERVEFSESGRTKKVRLTAPVTAGQNLRKAGEDFQSGQTVLGGGTLIEPHHIMALAATGIRSAPIRPAPRVSVITTGAELADADAPARAGMIQDANGPYLRAVLDRMGATIVQQVRVADAAGDIEAAIADCAQSSDIVLTTGGVSAGRYDLVPSIVTSTGGETLFHKVSIRPGKPVLGARLSDGTLLIGLPGNPVAAAVCMRFIAIPALRMLRGQSAESFHAAVTTTRITKRSELYFFGKARAGVDVGGQLKVEMLPGQESFKVSPLANANCWAIVRDGTDEISAGDLIKIAPLYPASFLQ